MSFTVFVGIYFSCLVVRLGKPKDSCESNKDVREIQKKVDEGVKKTPRLQVVLSENQPTNKGGGWRSPVVEDGSYESNYGPRGEAHGGHAQRKIPVLQGDWDYFSNAGYHSHHGYYFRRNHGGLTTESYGRRKTYDLQRNHRQREDSEVISRRTIDVGQAEYGPQYFGIEKSTRDGKEILRSGRSRKVTKYLGGAARKRRDDSNVTPADMSHGENTQNEQQTAAALTTNPFQGGGPGQKRLGQSHGGKGTLSHRRVTKPRPATLAANQRNRTQNVDFVFPDNIASFVPESNPCGEGATFCEDIGDEYPAEYISQLLTKEGNRFKEVFGWDSVPEMNITERVYKDETDLCASKLRVIFPQAGRNANGRWQFIVNHDKYRQGIGVETCENEDKPCKMADGFPLAYKTSCKQKFITRRLLSIEKSGAEMGQFLFPSCCVCSLQSVGLGTRAKPRS